MFTPETSKHFKKYTDESGVVSYILKTRVAPIQQGPYFTNPGMTPDGRFMWFGCTCPPSSQKFRAVIDFETDEIFVHYGTVGANNPWVLENGDVCFANLNFVKRVLKIIGCYKFVCTNFSNYR